MAVFVVTSSSTHTHTHTHGRVRPRGGGPPCACMCVAPGGGVFAAALRRVCGGCHAAPPLVSGGAARRGGARGGVGAPTPSASCAPPLPRRGQQGVWGRAGVKAGLRGCAVARSPPPAAAAGPRAPGRVTPARQCFPSAQPRHSSASSIRLTQPIPQYPNQAGWSSYSCMPSGPWSWRPHAPPPTPNDPIYTPASPIASVQEISARQRCSKC